MELGIYSFGDLMPEPQTGKVRVSQKERIDEVLAMAQLADQAGLDVFGLGEHHTPDYTVSATATVLAGIASTTKRIRLASASTLLSTADPVRTFEEFASVDLISGGRAEIIAGRGAFIEGFALFGYDLKDYDALFAEKIQLLIEINRSERVTWQGKYRPPLHEAVVMPRPYQERLPIWIGALSPQSIVRAAMLGLPLTMPVLGGSLPSYAQNVQLYREAWQAAGHDPREAKVAVFSHMLLAKSEQKARQELLPAYTLGMDYMMRRYRGQSFSRAAAEQMASRDGTLMLGDPDELVERILYMHELLGNVRFVGQIDVGGQPFVQVARAIELFASKVAPAVRKALA